MFGDDWAEFFLGRSGGPVLQHEMNRSFYAYSALLAVVAAACLAVAGWSVSAPDSSAHWNAVAAFVVVCFLTEASYFRLRVGRTETQSSVAFIPSIATFLLFDTGWAAAITGSAMFAVEFGVRKKPPSKIVFNTAQVVLSIAAASLVFVSLGGKPSLELATLRMPALAVTAAVATYFLLNSAAVSIAVSLALGERLVAAWLRIAGASLFYDMFSSSLAVVLAYLYARFQLLGIVGPVLGIYFIRHIYRVNLQLEQVNRDLLELMVKAIEARDPYTSGHSQRVSELAASIARELGLGSKLVDQIRTAALLHDVGKIHEEYAPLLRKEGKLDATEKALMQTHATRSAELAGTISAFRGTIVDAIRHHHENFDGTGYPLGLAGKAIPVGARIIMIADTIDAMSTDRPYRSALSYERVVNELRRFSGRQFDPSLVDIVIQSPTIQHLLAPRSDHVSLSPAASTSAPVRSPRWLRPKAAAN